MKKKIIKAWALIPVPYMKSNTSMLIYWKKFWAEETQKKVFPNYKVVPVEIKLCPQKPKRK